jgi:hypothetical protein
MALAEQNISHCSWTEAAVGCCRQIEGHLGAWQQRAALVAEPLHISEPSAPVQEQDSQEPSLTLTQSQHKLPNSRGADLQASSCTSLIAARFHSHLAHKRWSTARACTAFNETGLRASASSMVPPPIRTKFEPSEGKVSASRSQGWLRPFSWLDKYKAGCQQEPAILEEGCEDLVRHKKPCCAVLHPAGHAAVHIALFVLPSLQLCLGLLTICPCSS